MINPITEYVEHFIPIKPDDPIECSQDGETWIHLTASNLYGYDYTTYSLNLSRCLYKCIRYTDEVSKDVREIDLSKLE